LNGAAWLNEGQSASKAFWERIKDDFKSRPAGNATRQTKPVLKFRTVSARRDYPALWASLAPSYPNLKSKLVFKPEWLKETRFGEVLYKGDILLKELAYGVPILQEGELRAGKIERYVTAGYRDAAKGLLAQLEMQQATPEWRGALERQSTPEWRGARLWFDLTSERVSSRPTSTNPFPNLEPLPLIQPIPTIEFPPLARLATPRETRQWKRDARRSARIRAAEEAGRQLKVGSSGLRELLRARNLIENVSAQPVPVVAVKKDGNTLDLSGVYPHMFVRRHDQATGQDIPGSDPALDNLATDVNQRIDRYVNAYTELGVLADLFRAYVVAVQMMKDARPLCARIQAMPLLDAEKAVVPLPKEHPSELFVTVGSYEFTDGNRRWLFANTGQSINGGVSISGRSLYATAAKFAPTLITHMVDQALSRRPDRAEWEVNDRRFIAFNIASDLPIAESQFYAARTESNANDGVPVVLLGLTLLGFLWWYVAETRRARVAKAQKVRSIPTNSNAPDKSGCYPNGAWAMPDLSVRPLRDKDQLRDKDKERSFSDPEAAAHNIEVEFKNVFFNRTASRRERIVAHWMKLKNCSRSEAMRMAIDDWRKDQRSWR
jgi:hypothetical protein